MVFGRSWLPEVLKYKSKFPGDNCLELRADMYVHGFLG